MSRYLTLIAYTADILAARRAYRADRAVADGLCAVCKVGELEADRRRRCRQCVWERRVEVPR